MAFLLGIVLVLLLGVVHHFGLRALDGTTGQADTHPNRTMIGIFAGLVLLHTLEILGFAGVYALLLQWEWPEGGLSGEYDGSWQHVVYFSGINFITLGYTKIDLTGPLRMISMMESLGGFMVLTWSATFIYSVWQKAVGGK